MSNNVKIFVGVIIFLILGTVAGVLVQFGSAMPTGPGKYDAFATCLKDKGATFYGAFWCLHCQATKKEFGSSARLLPYVECSTLDAASQLQVCADKKIEGYPTWEFIDGSRLTGEVSLQQLADKTACVLPQ